MIEIKSWHPPGDQKVEVSGAAIRIQCLNNSKGSKNRFSVDAESLLIAARINRVK